MRLCVVAVGRLRDPRCRGLCDEYMARVSPGMPAQEVEVKEGREGTPHAVAAAEAERLLERIASPSASIALDGRGEPWSSEDLARFLGRQRDLGLRELRFVIGGAWGLGPAVLERCAQCWSLGPLTLPHELARVVVWEQLYRGWTILQGAPYHHGAVVGAPRNPRAPHG